MMRGVIDRLTGRRRESDVTDLLRASLALVQSSAQETRQLDATLHEVAASLLFSRWMATPDVLASRTETGYWLNWLGLAGHGVEVGVFQGEFSRQLLRTWRCASLVSIDAWREFPSEDYVDICNQHQVDHDRNYAITVERLRQFGPRSRVVRATSKEAAIEFPDSSLDFAYLDAQHHYEAVLEDLAIWSPKVRPGGVIGGHDYFDGHLHSGVYGVKQAVDEFVSASGYRLVVTCERDWPSWFARKV